ncbi:MAG: 30S ribosomal protein S8 [Alphaproteobacteria bacterium]|nr:30S ribosomal protein S8 [Rickettsiales bacterium]
MSSNYIIADVFSALRNIRNRYMKRTTVVPYSIFAEKLLKLLQENGYIINYKVSEIRKNVKVISVQIRFDASGFNVISNVKFYSKPSRRFYVGIDELRTYTCKSKAGLVVVSTDKGVKSGYEAIRAGIGGELICIIL